MSNSEPMGQNKSRAFNSDTNVESSNYKLIIQYDGTEFYGWQVQAAGRTVQGVIENALREIAPDQKITLIGSGRTDSGVHALHQTANVMLRTRLTAVEIQKAVNAKIQDDVYVAECTQVPNDFHARFQAVKREYYYHITDCFSPFTRKTTWWVRYPLDNQILHKCAGMVLGSRDFTSFCKATAEVSHKNCHIIESGWERKGNILEYKISANRFLQHMVRYLVGTMVEVARGRLKINDFRLLLDNSHPSISVYRAPARGLFLSNVYYQEK